MVIVMKIKLVLTDIDGCLTYNSVFYTVNGDKIKRFNMNDGMGVKILHENNILVGVISGDNSLASKQRMEDLGVDYIYIGIKSKMEILEEIANDLKISRDEIAYMGDDLQDLDVLKEVGLSVAPNNAVLEVKNSVKKVMDKDGGYGAFREFAEYVLDCNKKIEGEN